MQKHTICSLYAELESGVQVHSPLPDLQCDKVQQTKQRIIPRYKEAAEKPTHWHLSLWKRLQRPLLTKKSTKARITSAKKHLDPRFWELTRQKQNCLQGLSPVTSGYFIKKQTSDVVVRWYDLQQAVHVCKPSRKDMWPKFLILSRRSKNRIWKSRLYLLFVFDVRVKNLVPDFCDWFHS